MCTFDEREDIWNKGLVHFKIVWLLYTKRTGQIEKKLVFVIHFNNFCENQSFFLIDKTGLLNMGSHKHLLHICLADHQMRSRVISVMSVDSYYGDDDWLWLWVAGCRLYPSKANTGTNFILNEFPVYKPLLESSKFVPFDAHLRMGQSKADCTQPANRAAGYSIVM